MNPETDEAPREDPGFRIWVEHPNGDRIDVTHAVLDAYDIAISSMDFGSGFLSTEEVGNLRTLGKSINAQHFDYQHDKCLRCGHTWSNHGGYYGGSERCYADGGCNCAGWASPHGDWGTPRT